MNKYNHQLIATLLSFIVFSQAQAMDNSDQPESQSPKFAMENYFPVFICLFDNFDSRHVHVGSVCKIWNQYTKERLKYFYDFIESYKLANKNWSGKKIEEAFNVKWELARKSQNFSLEEKHHWGLIFLEKSKAALSEMKKNSYKYEASFCQNPDKRLIPLLLFAVWEEDMPVEIKPISGTYHPSFSLLSSEERLRETIAEHKRSILKTAESGQRITDHTLHCCYFFLRDLAHRDEDGRLRACEKAHGISRKLLENFRGYAIVCAYYHAAVFMDTEIYDTIFFGDKSKRSTELDYSYTLLEKPEYYYYAIRAFHLSGWWRGSIAVYEAIKPEYINKVLNPIAFQVMAAEAYFRVGKYAEAASLWNTVLKNSNRISPQHLLNYRVKAAIAFAHNDDMERAKVLAKAAYSLNTGAASNPWICYFLSLDPNITLSYEVLKAAATSLANWGKTAKAEELLKQAEAMRN